MTKSGMSKEEQQKDRLEVLDERKFLKKAKDYRFNVFLFSNLVSSFFVFVSSKYRKAVVVVTRDKNLARIKKQKASNANANAKPKTSQASKGPARPIKSFKNKNKGKTGKNEKEKDED